MDKIFISYRRDDCQDVVGRIYDQLVQRFGVGKVFKDVNDIPPGVDFRKHLSDTIEECTILLAVIGPKWTNATNQAGHKKLEDAEDFVRVEIELGMARDIKVIPVLVNGASMPSTDQLPDSMKDFAFLNAMSVRPDPDFHHDMERLIEIWERTFTPTENEANFDEEKRGIKFTASIGGGLRKTHGKEKPAKRSTMSCSVAIITAAFVGLLTVVYFPSDVFSPKVDQAALQWAAWTPENIQKDPAGYLAFAKGELEKANDSLEARQIALKKKQNEYKRKHSEAKIQHAKHDKLLLELRSKYSEATNSNPTASYPVEINGIPLKDEAALKKLAVKTTKKLKHQEKLVGTYAQFQTKLTAQVTKVEDQLEKLAEKREELALQTEVVLLTLQIDKFADVNDGLAAIFDTSVAIAGEPDAIDPDDLIDAGEVTATETEFAELGW